MSNKISGYTCVRNGVELDYCFELTIRSLLLVCDEVVVGYRSSTDNTLEQLMRICEEHPRVRVIHQGWSIDPRGDVHWWTRWVNEIRAMLSFEVQLMLDADEVLDDSKQCHDLLYAISEAGGCGRFRRLNFVRDAATLLPDGFCCGHEVTRLGPTQYFMPSDEPYSAHDMPIIHRLSVPTPILRIFHYGFIRKMSGFYPKVDINGLAFLGRASDPRLDEYRKTNAENWYEAYEWFPKLQHYSGTHPSIAIDWLKERGRL